MLTRYEGALDERAVRPMLGLLSSAELDRAQTLGRAMQLAYRLSGGVPK